MAGNKALGIDGGYALPYLEDLCSHEFSRIDRFACPPWARYGIERRRGRDSSGSRFDYLVEVGEPNIMSPELLKGEFFAEELRRVDVLQSDSLIPFCQRWGLCPSPFYHGAQRLALFRMRTRLKGDLAEERLFETGEGPCGAYLDLVAGHRGKEGGGASSKALDVREGIRLSCEARRMLRGDQHAVGVISELEVQSTVRLFQCAFALMPPVDKWYQSWWAGGTGGGTVSLERGLMAIADYLMDRAHLSQHGERLLLVPRRRAPALESRERGLLGDEGGAADAARIYATWRMTGRFLVDAVSSYMMPLTEVMAGDGTGTEGTGMHDVWGAACEALERRRKEERIPDYMRGSLPLAVIRNFTDIYDDPAEWRTCDNCGRIFKKYREEKPGKVIQKTRFCKRSCANSYSKKKAQGRITKN